RARLASGQRLELEGAGVLVHLRRARHLDHEAGRDVAAGDLDRPAMRSRDLLRDEETEAETTRGPTPGARLEQVRDELVRDGPAVVHRDANHHRIAAIECDLDRVVAVLAGI